MGEEPTSFKRYAAEVQRKKYLVDRWTSLSVSSLLEKCEERGCITRAESDEISVSSSTDSQRIENLAKLLLRKETRWQSVLQLLRYDSPAAGEIWKSSETTEICLPAIAQPPPEVPKCWHLGQLLGQGAFGKVYLCFDESSSQQIAVKKVSMPPKNADQDENEVLSLENEISLMSQLKHDRIVRYIGCQREENEVYIFMEYLPGGTLTEEIKRAGSLSEPTTRRYTQQILEGLKYLHDCNIVHRDIKSANILRDSEGNAKIGDFGTCKRLESIFTENGATSQLGTPYYMAPEVINGGGYGRKADIWSLACTVLEMLTGSHPWKGLNSMAAIFAIATQEPMINLPTGTSSEMGDFLILLFTRNPQERPSATEALSHAALQLN